VAAHDTSSPTLPEHSDVASSEEKLSQPEGADDEQSGIVPPLTSAPQAEPSHTDTPEPDIPGSDGHESYEPESTPGHSIGSPSEVVGQDVSAGFKLDGDPPSPDEDDHPDIPEELPAKEPRPEIERRPETEISPGVPPEHTPISPRTPEIPPREPNSVISEDSDAGDSSWSFIAWLASQRSARADSSQREEAHWQELSADTRINSLGGQPASREDSD